VATEYRGRFAPSPTGLLHFGSLIAALGSYLDAKHYHGKWLVRIEDLDTPRTIKGSAEAVLRTLEAFGLHWDESILYQSQRTEAYEEALQRLHNLDAIYACACTRKEIADSALHGIDGLIYPGTCRNKAHSLPNPLDETTSHSTKLQKSVAKSLVTPVVEGMKAARNLAWRVLTDIPFPPPTLGGRKEPYSLSHRRRIREGEGFVEFDDSLQGRITQHLENEIGDFLVKRADGLFAYQLAVVVDDAYQGITHVVRGADLLSSTPRQIYLQRLLGLSTPAYLHLPVAINNRGEKLSKQTLASPVSMSNLSATLRCALEFLHQPIPETVTLGNHQEILAWAITHWDRTKLRGITQGEVFQ
jgi:glutamyl-Q tRNA(Asp) synthetase